MSKVIGIDLGTTNSCIAFIQNGEPTVVTTPEGARTTPSVVAFAKNGERLVGHIAKRQTITNPTQTIYSVKRFMGSRAEEVKNEVSMVSYTVESGRSGEIQIKVKDQTFRPEEISAMILQTLKKTAEDFLGEAVDKAVITVPAYFNDAQRQATKDAGRIAGLEVLRIINEPTAAALAYGLDKSKTGVVAVYDLGGGTFDVSILELADGVYQVKSTSGDTHLGGDDFDRIIMDWILGEFKTQCGIDISADKMAMQRVRDSAEKAKCELSTTLETTINLPFLAADDTGPKHLELQLTRATLETLVEPLIRKTIEPCRTALHDAGIATTQIDKVILVGGSTRMPAVREPGSAGQGARLRPGEARAVGDGVRAAGTHANRAGDRTRIIGRHPRLHVAGAGARLRPGRPHGCLVARRRPLRDGGRPGPVYRDEPQRRAGGDSGSRADVAGALHSAGPRRAPAHRRQSAAQGSRAALSGDEGPAAGSRGARDELVSTDRSRASAEGSTASSTEDVTRPVSSAEYVAGRLRSPKLVTIGAAATLLVALTGAAWWAWLAAIPGRGRSLNQPVGRTIPTHESRPARGCTDPASHPTASSSRMPPIELATSTYGCRRFRGTASPCK